MRAVGLATARLIQESGRAVTIYARDLLPNTTSDIAGAQWFPFFVSEHTRRTGEFLQQFNAASEFAHGRFRSAAAPGSLFANGGCLGRQQQKKPGRSRAFEVEETKPQ